MSRLRSSLVVALGVTALAIPAGAFAVPGVNHGKGHGKGKGHTHVVAYIFKGTYVAPETLEDEGTVKVEHGNSRVRKGFLVPAGGPVEIAFLFGEARVVVADTNGDGQKTLADVKVGDKVLVKAGLPRKEAGDPPFTAQRLVDQSHPPTS